MAGINRLNELPRVWPDGRSNNRVLESLLPGEWQADADRPMTLGELSEMARIIWGPGGPAKLLGLALAELERQKAEQAARPCERCNGRGHHGGCRRCGKVVEVETPGDVSQERLNKLAEGLEGIGARVVVCGGKPPF